VRLRSPIVITLLALFVAACASPSAGSPEESSAPASDGGEPSQAAESQAASESQDAAASLAPGDLTSVFDLNNGDCFNSPAAESVDEVAVTDCADGHEFEIYYVVNFDAGPLDPYPGSEAITSFVNEQCSGQFETFVGTTYEESDLYIYYLAPTEDSWGTGDREVLCALYWPDINGDNQPLTGSMEGSNR